MKRPSPILAIAMLGALLAAPAPPALAADAAEPTVSDVIRLELDLAHRNAIIRDRAGFDLYMLANPTSANPVNLLSETARRRFVAALDFDLIKMGGISDAADIEAELSLSQAWRLVALFGVPEGVLNMPDIRVESDDDRRVDDWRKILLRD